MRAILMLLFLSPLVPAQQSPEVAAGLAAGSYFPLEIGDHWVYRADSRIGTGAYETWRIDRTDTANGNRYFVMGIYGVNSTLVGEDWFRADDQGRIFVLTGNSDQLFLDPRLGGDPGQLNAVGQGGSYRTAVGMFSDTLIYANSDPFLAETGQFARGVGLLWSSQTMRTGSSGGFVYGRSLVEAVVGGGAIHFTATAGIHVGMESLTLDVTGKKVTNCVLPCYFVACGFGPTPPDPEGTYKPCARARVSLENWPTDASLSVRLRLVAPDTTVLYDQKFALTPAPGDVTLTAQIPLYSAPNQPFPPGAYQLSASTDDGSASSALTVTVQ